MQLKKVEIYGFKSFREKTRVDLSPGMTAIVGPNGCGKSNLADAIRWALGEQSARSLRGSKMEDVIFNGTDKHRPLGFAEVSLTFDNQGFPSDRGSQWDPREYSEINITRRYYRSGESQFLLNKIPCRLKEITSLFQDTGIGKGAYTIISQGKIDQVLSARPQDRLGIFEEAAGVYGYRVQKREVQKNMQETAGNLGRVSDLIEELEQQLPALEEDAARARGYLDCREKLKGLETGVLAEDIRRNRDSQEKLENQVKQLESQRVETMAQLGKLEGQLGQEKLELQDLQGESGYLRGEFQALQGRVREREGEKALLQERINNLAGQRSTLEEGQAESRDKVGRLREKKEALEERLGQLQGQGEQGQEELSRLEAGLQGLKGGQSRLQRQEEKSSRLAGLTREIDQVSLEIKKKELEEKYNSQRRQELARDIEKRQGALGGMVRLLQEKESLRGRKQAELEALQGEKGGLEDRLRQEEHKVYTLQERLKGLSLEREKARTRWEALEGMVQRREGLPEAVRAVLMARERGLTLARGVEGVVADLLEVPPRYTRALAVALGAAAQQVVTGDEETARQVIGYLKKERKGRATFLPLSLVQPYRGQRPVISDIPLEGWASDLVSCPEKYRKVKEKLLGKVLVVEKLETALELGRRLGLKYKIVTLEGEVIYPGGAITGGSFSRRDQDYISRKNQLQALQEKYAGIDKEYRETQEAWVQQDKERKGWEEKLEALGDPRELQQEIKVLKEEMSREEREKESLAGSLASLGKELQGLEESGAAGEAETLGLVDRARELARQEGELSRELDKEKAWSSDYFQLVREKEGELARCRAAYSSLVAETDRTRGELGELEEEIKRVTGKYTLQEERYSKLEAQEKGLLLQQQHIHRELQELMVRQEETGARLEQKQKEIEGLSWQAKEKEGQGEKYRASLRSWEKKAHGWELESARRQVEYESLLYRWEEDFSREGGELEGWTLEVPLEQARAEIPGLRQTLQEYGLVNTGALDEYRRLKERVEFLKKQREDLREAKTTLHRVLKQLEEKINQEFLQSINQIKASFSSVFRDFFSGGRAYLKVLDQERVLEAGIEIIAQPPGKKLQSLDLLSGGERALTAIALLFSLLKVKPVPFCILDEIEASLDSLNLKRFNQQLEVIAGDTTTLVITHRRETMEACQVLYGLTMEDPGVSRVFSLKVPSHREQKVS